MAEEINKQPQRKIRFTTKNRKEFSFEDGSKFTVKPKAVGFDICAFVGILLDKAHIYNNVIREIEKIPEIVECHFTTGTWALLVKIYCVDNQHLMDVLVNKMQNIPGVARTETFISLEQTIDREFSI